MSWFPGTARSGRPSPVSSACACASSRVRPRCARSPVAITSSGSTSSTRAARATSRPGVSRRPAWRSETCSVRVVTAVRGYTLGAMSEQTPEIFDDLYLGLQAGGALRKQRRGEELTVEEEQALSRWQRLSVWRKGLAIGAFSVGDLRARLHRRRARVRSAGARPDAARRTHVRSLD